MSAGANPPTIDLEVAKEIRGSVMLPGNPDLFFLSLVAAVVTRRPLRLAGIDETPLVRRWINLWSGRLDISVRDGAVAVVPCPEFTSAPICFSSTDLPYRDLCIFALLGSGAAITFAAISPQRFAAWSATARVFGCTVETLSKAEGSTLSLSGAVALPADAIVAPDEVHPLLGLAFGRRIPIGFSIEHQLSTPLRDLLGHFGMPLSVRSATAADHESNVLRRRLRFMQSKKRGTESKAAFVVSADFSIAQSGEVAISLPGDDVLAGLLYVAKSIVPKGAFVIGNVPLESWSNATLNLIRKMGCKPAIQEERMSSFGSTGMVQLQKFSVAGRKSECRPLDLHTGQLAGMILLTCFAEGQSVFRGLADLRNDEPDRLEQVYQALRLLGCRFGEMPDGMVIDGARQYDGFDLTDDLSAPLCGAWAIAGLTCMGRTTVAAGSILERWPGFKPMLDGICAYRV
jgi:hypothetical protein